MFFTVKGSAEPCGMFTIGHLILIIITSLCIAIAVHFTKQKQEKQIHRIICALTIILWILEIARIGFVTLIECSKNLKT